MMPTTLQDNCPREPYYTTEYLHQSATRWLDIGEHSLYAQGKGTMVEISCNVGMSLSKSAVNLTLLETWHCI